MPRVAVVSITHRTLNNIAPLLHGLIAAGVDCDVVWAPTSQAVAALSPRSLGLAIALDPSGTDARGQGRACSLRCCVATLRRRARAAARAVGRYDHVAKPGRLRGGAGAGLQAALASRLAARAASTVVRDAQRIPRRLFFLLRSHPRRIARRRPLRSRAARWAGEAGPALCVGRRLACQRLSRMVCAARPAVQQQVDLLAAIAAAQSLPVVRDPAASGGT